ncbi:DUF2911 domain-containing protein [Chitinophaga sp. Hz27]|uniref:DUF2911 domain-containing protein n=1 Tax=Chitinophaga sp. Hz27 TaxID=3347169 RepID=UPI0035DC1035
MKNLKTFVAASSCAFLLYAGASMAQGVKVPAPSPTQTIKQEFALSSVEIDYSRPNAKGRVIMGDLVPYNKVWRTGANKATTITFGEDVKFGDVAVKAGKYGLLTIPGQQKWTVILTTSLDVTKPADYKQENDVARVTVTPQRSATALQSFTIGFDNIKYNSMVLTLAWDKTVVPVTITADVDKKIEADLDAALQSDKKPYFQAALYYADLNTNLKKAVEYIDKAAEQNSDAFYIIYQKARIHSLVKDNATAKAAALKSLELSKAAKSDDYIALNNKLLATLK